MNKHERESQKIVEVNGKSYLIKKLDPDTVVPWALKVIGKIGAPLLGMGIQGTIDMALLADGLENLFNLRKAEYQELKNDFLAGVFLKYGEEGTLCVIDSFGKYTQSLDAFDVMDLLQHSIGFNLAGFFTKERLTKALQSLPKVTADSSTDQKQQPET